MRRNRLPALLCLWLFCLELWGLPANLVHSLVYAQSNSQRYRDPVFERVATINGLIYGQAFNTVTGKQDTLHLDYYEPEGDTLQKRPAVVLVHGGGFTGGDKSRLSPVAMELARRGYVAVSINYRLHTSYIGPQDTLELLEATTMAFEDTKAAVRWLRAHATEYRLDEQRIGLLGVSAGAFAVLHAAYEEAEGQSGSPGYSSEVRACVEISGGLIDDSVLEPGEAPVLIIHGTQDQRVPFAQAIELRDRASAVNVPYEFHAIEGADHNLVPYFPAIIGWTLDFFLRYLIGEIAVPVEFVRFYAMAKDFAVYLHWETASETQNAGFDIERRTRASRWQKLGFVEGGGTSVRPRSYVYVDRSPPAGEVFYRLKQIDFDGNGAYSSEIAIQVEMPDRPVLQPAYPNPFIRRHAPSVILELYVPEASNARPALLQVFDMLGKEVYFETLTAAGWYRLRWNGQTPYGLPVSAGLYWYRLTWRNFQVQRPLVVR